MSDFVHGQERERSDTTTRRPAGGETESERDARAGGLLDLQQNAGNAAVTSMLQPTPGDLVRSVVGSPGRPLDSTTASFVRSAAGHDPSGIRVHDGPQAAAAASSVQAEMFASGNHLVAPSGLDVSTAEGAFKTVHEVHHIVSQQAHGPVAGTVTDDGLKISDPSDRFEREADAVAAQAVAGHLAGGSGASAGPIQAPGLGT
ncbi:MAG: eCIS core domain-containing protein [Acidimicrobiales bacterium]